MTDNEFWTNILNIVQAAVDNSALVVAGGSNIEVVEGYQPRQQGQPINPFVTFNQISSKRYGWQGKKDVYNPGTDVIDHTESYILERTIQVNANVTENPADLSLSTAFDIVDMIANKLQGSVLRESLLALGIGIIRITDIRTPYVKEDSDRFMMQPNFDFTVNYKQSNVTPVTKINEPIELNIQTV